MSGAGAAQLVLRPRQGRQLLRGHPWAFRNQIGAVEGSPRTGDVVGLRDADGRRLGAGFYHESSLIAFRFLGRHVDAPVDAAFFEARLARALEHRRLVFGGERHFRWVFSESDGLPGTIVDVYGEIVCWSTLCAGVDQRREALLDAIESLLGPRAIIERNDDALRAKDGLPERRGVVRGALDGPVAIEEHGLRFEIDPLEGPKTGWFLDQRLHRAELRRFARGRRVLDVFSADGGFGLQAAAAGAAHVQLVDGSAAALERARRNAALNGLGDRVELEKADALDRLARLADAPEGHDLVVLDPPAFAKSRRHVAAARRAYQSININALRLLPERGVLATSSCSHAIDEREFESLLRYSARRAGCGLRVLYRGSQPPDHPVLVGMPETHYLKFTVVQKTGDELPGADAPPTERETTRGGER